MEKQSVGFVIDNTVLNSHVGVRRYLLSMAQALCREFNVRLFNVEYEPINNKPFFTELYVDNQFAKDNGFSINHIVGQNKNEILKKLPSVFFNRNSKKKGQDNIYACSYGAYFPEDLDTIIVAAPWVMKGELDLKAKKEFIVLRMMLYQMIIQFLPQKTKAYKLSHINIFSLIRHS